MRQSEIVMALKLPRSRSTLRGSEKTTHVGFARISRARVRDTTRELAREARRLICGRQEKKKAPTDVGDLIDEGILFFFILLSCHGERLAGGLELHTRRGCE